MASVAKQSVFGGIPGASTRSFGAASDTTKTALPVEMPALSPTMKVVQWTKQVGEAVEPGDVLCEIETDKAKVGFENQEEGYLARILVSEGVEVPVGHVLAIMVDSEGEIAAAQQQDWSHLLGTSGGPPQEAPHASEAPASASSSSSAVRLSPAAARVVRQHGLNPSDIRGTGKHGMITKTDALVHMGSVAPRAAAESVSPTEATATPSREPPGVVEPVAAPQPEQELIIGRPASVTMSGSFTDEKPSSMRRVIASRLAESKATIPHYYTLMECRIDALLAFRKQLKAQGLVVSVNDLLIKAAAHALRDVPKANAFYDAATDSVQPNETVDVSVAVATKGGLITPIVRGADSLGVTRINETVKDLALRARKGALQPSEYQGGTFTISNLGMFGIDEFTAVINPPQACILAVGRGEEQVVYPEEAASEWTEEEMRRFHLGNGDYGFAAAEGVGAGTLPEPEVATIMNVQLSADRRVVDEFVAGQFLQVLARYCATPSLLLA